MTSPFLYQLQTVRQIQKWKGRALVALDMGLGKSFISLLWANRNPQAKPIVIVCPSSIKWNWANEARKHFRTTAQVISGYRPPRTKPLKVAQLVVVNFDVLHDKVSRHGVYKGWSKWIKDKIKPKLVIIDEISYIKSRTSARTRAVRSICKDVPHVLGLGGTAGMENSPSEMFPFLNICRPDLFPQWLPFGFKFCGPVKNPFGGWLFKGATNSSQLRKLLLENVMIRKRKDEVLTQLPKKRRIVTLLDIQYRSRYEEAVKDFSGWLRKNYNKEAKAEGLVKIGYLLRLTAKLKMRSVMEWIDDWMNGSEGKIILFAVHHKVVDFLHERYKSESVIVTGEVTGRKRQNAFDQFLRDKRTRMLIGNVQASGYGWSATGVSTTAFVELAWVPGLHIQAEDRTHGLGRGVEGVRSESWYLVAKGTIEELLCKTLQRKQKNLSKVLDGGRQSSDIDIYTELTRQLLIKT